MDRGTVDHTEIPSAGAVAARLEPWSASADCKGLRRPSDPRRNRPRFRGPGQPVCDQRTGAIMMDRRGVAESLAVTLQWCAQPDPLATPLTEQQRATAMREIAALVALVLYLCSENAEVREPGPLDRRHALRFGRKGAVVARAGPPWS